MKRLELLLVNDTHLTHIEKQAYKEYVDTII